jgi:hypothetical protein
MSSADDAGLPGGGTYGVTMARGASVLVRLALGTTLLVAAEAGLVAGERYVWADLVLNHPFLFGALAWMLLSSALIGRLQPGMLRAALLAGSACGGVVLVVGGVVTHGVGLSREARKAAAPGATYVAVVEEDRGRR